MGAVKPGVRQRAQEPEENWVLLLNRANGINAMIRFVLHATFVALVAFALKGCTEPEFESAALKYLSVDEPITYSYVDDQEQPGTRVFRPGTRSFGGLLEMLAYPVSSCEKAVALRQREASASALPHMGLARLSQKTQEKEVVILIFRPDTMLVYVDGAQVLSGCGSPQLALALMLAEPDEE